jgi:hypothetical protein
MTSDDKYEWKKPPDGVVSSHVRKVPLWFKVLMYFFILFGVVMIGASIVIAIVLGDDLI